MQKYMEEDKDMGVHARIHGRG